MRFVSENLNKYISPYAWNRARQKARLYNNKNVRWYCEEKLARMDANKWDIE